MFEVLKKLISKHFYKTADEAQHKIDVFYATNRLSDEQYTTLTAQINTEYQLESV